MSSVGSSRDYGLIHEGIVLLTLPISLANNFVSPTKILCSVYDLACNGSRLHYRLLLVSLSEVWISSSDSTHWRPLHLGTYISTGSAY